MTLHGGDRQNLAVILVNIVVQNSAVNIALVLDYPVDCIPDLIRKGLRVFVYFQPSIQIHQELIQYGADPEVL